MLSHVQAELQLALACQLAAAMDMLRPMQVIRPFFSRRYLAARLPLPACMCLKWRPYHTLPCFQEEEEAVPVSLQTPYMNFQQCLQILASAWTALGCSVVSRQGRESRLLLYRWLLLLLPPCHKLAAFGQQACLAGPHFGRDADSGQMLGRLLPCALFHRLLLFSVQLLPLWC